MADKIFINYRRADSIGTAGRLSDRLAKSFGKQNLFMDVDSIPAGVDFIADLKSRVAQCRIFLVIIGSNWLDVRDESGERRLDSPDDFVTIEIAAALERDIRVIPVLVDGARMPKADQLPECIKPLVRRNAVELRNTQFGRDSEALVTRVRGALRESSGWRRKRMAAGVTVMAVMALVGLTVYAWMAPGVPGTLPPKTTAGPTAPLPINPGNILDQPKQLQGKANAPASAPVAPVAPEQTKVFYNPMYAGARVDWCYKNGVSCGREAAIAYCNYQKYKSLADQDGFEIDPNIWSTKTLAGDQNNGRDGFRFIKCVEPMN